MKFTPSCRIPSLLQSTCCEQICPTPMCQSLLIGTTSTRKAIPHVSVTQWWKAMGRGRAEGADPTLSSFKDQKAETTAEAAPTWAKLYPPVKTRNAALECTRSEPSVILCCSVFRSTFAKQLFGQSHFFRTVRIIPLSLSRHQTARQDGIAHLLERRQDRAGWHNPRSFSPSQKQRLCFEHETRGFIPGRRISRATPTPFPCTRYDGKQVTPR